MNPNTDLILPSSIGPAVAVSVDEAPKRGLDLRTFISLLSATLATAVSLAIAGFAGWQRGGLPIERAMNVSLCCVAVLYVHLLPVVWRALGVVARICASGVWWLAFAVVLFGQVSFFMLSQQHAGDERAATVTMPPGPPGEVTQAGRTRTQITQDIASLTAALAQANARRCTGDCAALTVRRQTLTSRLAALGAENDEALRREADQDRGRKQADRVEALREMSRADPVALVVAAKLHTTENLFALIVAVACAVVLEGTAILGWLLTTVAFSRAIEPQSGAVSRATVVGDHCRVSLPVEVESGAQGAVVPSQFPIVTTGGDCLAASDAVQLAKIHDAVVAGKIRKTQGEIRTLLSCSQREAGRLNRLYADRTGDTR